MAPPTRFVRVFAAHIKCTADRPSAERPPDADVAVRNVFLAGTEARPTEKWGLFQALKDLAAR